MDLPRAPRSAAARVVVISLIMASVATGGVVRSLAETASSTGSIASAGFLRTYHLYRPAIASTGGVPLVIVLHPAGGSGIDVEAMTGFDALADSAGFLVAYPDAKDNGLWEWGCCPVDPLRVQTADNRFISDLIDHLVATQGVDPSRVYVAGFSIGAAFAHRLACQLADKITAIGSVGGTEQVDQPCRPDRAVSIVEIKGEQPDEWYNGSCPVNGICSPHTKGYAPSAPQLDAQWRSLDACPAPATYDLAPIAHVSAATGCEGGTQVVLVSIDAVQDVDGDHGHHCWPGASGCPPPPDATSYLWSQFAPLRSVNLPPAPPSGVHAHAVAGQVTVAWTAPRGNGAPVLAYDVVASPGGRAWTVSGAVAHATLAGIAPGSYRFTVRAVNVMGNSGWSSPSAPTPVDDPSQSGYWMLGVDGASYAFGGARFMGSATGPVVAMAARPDGNGYWITDSRGDVSHFGAAGDHGGHPILPPGELVSTISATPSGQGYLLFTDRGRAIPYGDAQWRGDMRSAPLNGSIVASGTTPTGRGYYMVGSDGGVFTFGDARFHGSTGARRLNRPIVGISATPDNRGYWLVAADGGVFAFNAPFRGSMGGATLNRPVDGLVAVGNGYLMVASDGGVFDFSDITFAGSLANHPPRARIVGVAAFPGPS